MGSALSSQTGENCIHSPRMIQTTRWMTMLRIESFTSGHHPHPTPTMQVPRTQGSRSSGEVPKQKDADFPSGGRAIGRGGIFVWALPFDAQRPGHIYRSEPAPRDFVSFNMERRRVSSTATPGTPSSSFSHWSTRLRHHCRRPTRCTLRVTARYTRNAIHVLFALDGSRLMHLLSCRTPPTSAPFWRPRSRALGIPNIINVRPPRGNSRGRRAVPPRTFLHPGIFTSPNTKGLRTWTATPPTNNTLADCADDAPAVICRPPPSLYSTSRPPCRFRCKMEVNSAENRAGIIADSFECFGAGARGAERR